MSKLTTDQINSLLNKYLKSVLEDDEASRIMQEGPLSPDLSEAQLSDYNYMEVFVQENLANCDYSFASKIVDRWILEPNGIEADKDSFEYKKLCRDLLKINIQICRIQRNREVGDYSDTIEYFPEEASAPEKTDSKENEAEFVSLVMKQYVDEAKRAGNWTPKTKSEIKAILDLFVRTMGDVPITSIDRPMIRTYKQILMKLPPNMNKVKVYRDKSIKEIISMDVANKMSTTTVNKNLGKLSSFFKYAVKNGFINNNPAEGMQLPKKRRDDEYRDPFNRDDLDKLFYSEEYLEDRHQESYAFWTPIISLFTGCRLEEIAQLHLNDVREEEGVWVLDINDRDEKKVKSKASKRLVPLHPILTNQLNLLGYVNSLKANGESRLFPELSLRRDGYGQTVSKWFGRYRKRCGVNGKRKTFHSFRHTFITTLKHNRVDPFMLHEIDGHTIDSMTMGRYGKRYTPRVLYEDAILKLNYDLDFAHLKNSKYVIK